MLLLTLETFFFKLMNGQVYKVILIIISIAYPTWAIGQFFGKGKVTSYLKAFIAYIAGYILFYIGIAIVGIITDIVVKTFFVH